MFVYVSILFASLYIWVYYSYICIFESLQLHLPFLFQWTCNMCRYFGYEVDDWVESIIVVSFVCRRRVSDRQAQTLDMVLKRSTFRVQKREIEMIPIGHFNNQWYYILKNATLRCIALQWNTVNLEYLSKFKTTCQGFPYPLMVIHTATGSF